MHEQGAVGCIPLPYLALGAWPQILPTLDGSIDFIEFIECIVARRAALSTSKETNPPKPVQQSIHLQARVSINASS